MILVMYVSTAEVGEFEEPGPSGLTSSPHVSHSCDVVCIDDDEDVIIVSDSDPA